MTGGQQGYCVKQKLTVALSSEEVRSGWLGENIAAVGLLQTDGETYRLQENAVRLLSKPPIDNSVCFVVIKRKNQTNLKVNC